MHVFQSSASQAEITAFYDEQLEARGYVSAGAKQGNTDALGYIKDGVEVILSLTKNDDGTTNVGMAEAGAAPDRGPRGDRVR
jgi:hypothetical protein